MSPESPRRLQPLCDRIGRERVETVVARFYDRLETDPRLGRYFSAIPDLEAHRRRIADFWWIAMGGRLAAPPEVDMVGAHRPLGLSTEDFSHWLALFDETVHRFLPADLADQWLLMAKAVAQRLIGQVVDR
ncbi:MAG: group III truncated hemoglobin [Gammaproteobacteria bacterium]